MPFPIITFPGVTGVKSLDMTTSVGITPATITMVVFPGDNPAITGTLVFGDGVNPPIVFPNCFCKEPTGELTKNTSEKVLLLQDRRWRWKYGFPIEGHWNQGAGSGKLVPWSVRSPFQLAYRLLQQMGELINPTNAADQIDLPGGLAHPSLPYHPTLDRPISDGGQYLGMGQNYGLTQSNPEVQWTARPAAKYLADLAEYYGRFVVLNPIDNRVRIVKIGSGAGMPVGVGKIRTGTVTQRDNIPVTQRAQGVATEYQLRLRLRAVAREWDRSWRPVNEVSYAPLVTVTNGQKMVCLASWEGTFDNTKTYGVTVNATLFTVGPGEAADFPDLSAAFADAINGSPEAAAVTATVTVAGGYLRVEARNVGVEFEFTTDGTDAPAAVKPAAGWWTWQATCIQGPIRGDYPRQNAHLVSWPDQPKDSFITLTVNGVFYFQPVAGDDLNALADATDQLAAQVTNVAGATAVAGGRLLTVTGLNPGTVITVAAGSSAGMDPTATEVATALAPARGWERTPGPPFGYNARVPVSGEYGYGQYSYQEAKRLANESVFTCYQVVLEDPGNPLFKSIPVPELGRIINQFLLLLQPDSPTPVVPEPGLAQVIDARTLQPGAAPTYNGYAVRRPNRVYGSVAKHILDHDGLLWRGGVYLQHNTAPRQRLPITFSIIDPEQQVIQFSQPLYRYLGSNSPLLLAAGIVGPTAFTYQPAELVIECGALCLDGTTLTPVNFGVSVAVPGGFGPPATQTFPDIRREVIGTYDARHNLTGFTTLDQDATLRATNYARALADGYQSPDGEEAELPGLLPVGLSGKVRQVRWLIQKDEPGVSTSVSVNCEMSRTVLPYPQRRQVEGVSPDAARIRQNMESDIRSRNAERNALRAVQAAAGGWFNGR